MSGHFAIVAAKVQPFYEKLKKERMAEAGREGGKIGGRGRPKGDRGEVISPHPYEERAPQSREQAAAALNVSPAAVQRAKYLLKNAPEEAAKVEAGEKGVWEAYNEVRPKAKPRTDLGDGGEAAEAPGAGVSIESEASSIQPEPDKPTHYMGKEPFACQTDRFSLVGAAESQPRKLALRNDIQEAGHRLALHYDRLQTAALIRSWARFWQPSLIRQVIQTLTKMENSQ